jgi:hypothetical protein
LQLIAYNDEPHAGRGASRRMFFTFLSVAQTRGAEGKLPELKIQPEEIDAGK